MKNSDFDFAAFLLDAVSQYGVVTVPGLGVFRGVLVPAKADQVQGVVLPPRVQFSFSAQSEEQGLPLIPMVAQALEISFQAADVLMVEVVEGIWNRLKLLEPVAFHGMGVLRMDTSGTLKFEVNESSSYPLTFGLDKIEAVSLMRKPADVLRQPANKPLVESISNEVILSKPPVKRHVRWHLVVGALVILIAVTYLFIRVGWLGIQDLSKQTPSNRSIQAISASDTIVGGEAVSDRMASTLSPEGDSTKTVVIAIGLFRDSVNVERLVERITAGGFRPYTVSEGVLTRVGISFSYRDENEIPVKLEEVRKAFEPGAFVLKK